MSYQPQFNYLEMTCSECRDRFVDGQPQMKTHDGSLVCVSCDFDLGLGAVEYKPMNRKKLGNG